MDDDVSKPLRPDMLAAVLAQWLQHDASVGPLATGREILTVRGPDSSG